VAKPRNSESPNAKFKIINNYYSENQSKHISYPLKKNEFFFENMHSKSLGNEKIANRNEERYHKRFTEEKN